MDASDTPARRLVVAALGKWVRFDVFYCVMVKEMFASWVLGRDRSSGC